jgi:putative endonuclease
MNKQYYIYILANERNTVLYTGVTGDLTRRVYQHREKLVEGFTKRYHVTKLIYYEETQDAVAAIEREKQIKGWSRKRKVELVNSFNPDWDDLYEGI